MNTYRFIYEITDADGEMDLGSVDFRGATYREAQGNFATWAKTRQTVEGVSIHVERADRVAA